MQRGVPATKPSRSYVPKGKGCVVSEFRLLGTSGIAMQEAIAQQGIRLPIVYVTGFAETRLTVAAMKAGVRKPPRCICPRFPVTPFSGTRVK